MQARITILGSGTSTGVPVPACQCEVCASKDRRDQRRRSSALISVGEAQILLDASADFRQQALAVGLSRVDAVLLTHHHADHISGLDDLRPFSWVNEIRSKEPKKIPVYAAKASRRWLQKHFAYFKNPGQRGGGVPNIAWRTARGSFTVCSLKVTAIPLWHGQMPALGYRLGDFAYLTDVSAVPKRSWPLLAGVRHLVIDGLRRRPHETHFTFAQAAAVGQEIGAANIWLTHISHEVPHRDIAAGLPENCQPAYDGLQFDAQVTPAANG